MRASCSSSHPRSAAHYFFSCISASPTVVTHITKMSGEGLMPTRSSCHAFNTAIQRPAHAASLCGLMPPDHGMPFCCHAHCIWLSLPRVQAESLRLRTMPRCCHARCIWLSLPRVQVEERLTMPRRCHAHCIWLSLPRAQVEERLTLVA